MPRADPTRSDYCAARHLLRNLRDARALRANPLAAQYVADDDVQASLARLSSAVESAFATMDAQNAGHRWRTARHTSILLRMDVGREDVIAVARDLGVSERQLRRERHAAHARFVLALRAVSNGAPARVEDRSARLQLDRAERLADSGEASSALAILGDVAARAPDAPSRCRALVRAADVEADMHRLGRARERLADARALMGIESVGDGERAALEREHRRSALQCAWFASGPAAVTAAALGGDAPESDDAAGWVQRASAALRAGDGAGARRLAAAAHTAIERCGDVALALDVQIIEAQLCDFIEGDHASAEALYARVIERAGEHGFGGRRLWATHGLLFTRWLHGPGAANRAAYRALIERVDASLPEQQRLMLSCAAADIELAIGSPRRAAAAAQRAARCASNDYERLSADALYGGALLRMGRVREAADAVARAASGGRRIGYLRVVSTAQRIAAEAALALGDRHAAHSCIDESLACATGRTSLYVLARTYDVAARVTRLSRHRALARDLRAAVSA